MMDSWGSDDFLQFFVTEKKTAFANIIAVLCQNFLPESLHLFATPYFLQALLANVPHRNILPVISTTGSHVAIRENAQVVKWIRTQRHRNLLRLDIRLRVTQMRQILVALEIHVIHP